VSAIDVASAAGPEDQERASRPEHVIDGSRARLGGTLADVWEFRAVLVAFAQRSIKVKYAQAVIGLGWVVIQPLMTAVILTVVFGRLAHVSSEGAPFLAFAMCGLVVWLFFSNSLILEMNSVVDDSVLLRKVYFPRMVLPMAAVLASAVDAVPAIVILIVVALGSGVEASFAWILIPIPMAVVGLGALAFGLAPAALNVYYRDIRYILPFIVQVGLFASPVVYSLTTIAEPWRTVYGVLSPPAGAIESMRYIVLRGELPPLQFLLGPLLTIGIVGAFGMALFSRMERSFADRV